MARKSRAMMVGLLSGITAGMDFKIAEWKTQIAQEAEERKQARLEQLKIDAENRAHERALELKGVDKDIADEARRDNQEHEVAKMGLDYEYQRMAAERGFQYQSQLQAAREAAASARQDDQQAAEVERDQWRHDNPTPTQADNDGIIYFNPQTGDRKWIPRGQVPPAGYNPEVGYGSTFAPSASKGGGTNAPGVNRPAAPRNYSGFSATQN